MARSLLWRGFAQSYKAAPLSVQRSTRVDQLKALRAAKPSAPATEIADAANRILDKSGINFAVSFDSASCKKIKRVKEQAKKSEGSAHGQCDVEVCGCGRSIAPVT